VRELNNGIIIDLMVEMEFIVLLLIFASIGYFVYFLIALDEMKGRPRIKRIVWLWLIPSLPIFVLICLLFNLFFEGIFYSLIALIFFVILGEVSEIRRPQHKK